MNFETIGNLPDLVNITYQTVVYTLDISGKLSYAQLQAHILSITALSQGAYWAEVLRQFIYMQTEFLFTKLQPILETVDKALKIMSILQS